MTYADFIAAVDRWIANEWPDVAVDRPSLLLAGAMAQEIADESTEDGPSFGFVIDGVRYDWFEGDGWDCQDAHHLLNVLAAGWAAGTLPRGAGENLTDTATAQVERLRKAYADHAGTDSYTRKVLAEILGTLPEVPR
jgi:hypothetical protein